MATQAATLGSSPTRGAGRISSGVRAAAKPAVTGWKMEPVVFQGAIQAMIALGLAFHWWTWNDAQTGAVIGIVASFLALITRNQVTPTYRGPDGGQVERRRSASTA